MAVDLTAVRAPRCDDYHRSGPSRNAESCCSPASGRDVLECVKTWARVTINRPRSLPRITDNRIPYWVYGGQQESGSVGTTSRGDYGAITFRDWYPVGVEEYGYVAPDPLDPNIVYGGKITRFDHRSREVQDISPEPVRSGKYRFLRTAPVIFSTVDPHTLYFVSNVLFKTTNGGHSWDIISPDLTRRPTTFRRATRCLRVGISIARRTGA